jgi:hypothetical protein
LVNPVLVQVGSCSQDIFVTTPLFLYNKNMNRKEIPIYSGVLCYFPDALKEVAKVSFQGSKQHHPNQPLHWDRNKSTDELDALMRHLIDHAKGEIYDTDGMRHLSKVCWRSLAMLQKELEK